MLLPSFIYFCTLTATFIRKMCKVSSLNARSYSNWPQMKYKLIGLVRSRLLFKLIWNMYEKKFHFTWIVFFFSYQHTRRLIVPGLNSDNTKESLLPLNEEKSLFLKWKLLCTRFFFFANDTFISDFERLWLGFLELNVKRG